MPRFLLLLLLFSMAIVAHADMYRWVDSEGRIHVSDSLPPAAARFGYDILTAQGRVIRRVDAPLTQEEEAAQAAAEKEAAEKAARIKAEQEQKARRDRILTLTYGTVGEIELARDERISLLESYIQLNQKNLKQKEGELEAIKKRIQPFVEKGNPVPEAFSSKQTRLAEEVATLNGNIEHQKQQLEDLKQRFASDIQRFEEIQEEKKKAKAATN